VTEQGEITFARYGNRQIAHRHLAQVTNAVLRASTPSHERDDRAPAADVVEQMRTTSMAAWRTLIDTPGFVDFFLAATPIDEIGDLPLGSRPARRTESTTDVETLRAIPWVFAWAQARVNLPGWYGLGTGLEAVLAHAEGLAELQRLYREWPFFTSLLQNAELSLVKADLPLAQLHLALGARPDLVASIEDEYRRTVTHVLAVTGHEQLLEEEPRLARDIELRNPYVDALSFLQVRFLRELREGIDDPTKRAAVRRLVQLTVNGVAAGLQNTG
jgi:phosphoenolpyruvate carboxylase